MKIPPASNASGYIAIIVDAERDKQLAVYNARFIGDDHSSTVSGVVSRISLAISAPAASACCFPGPVSAGSGFLAFL